MVLFSPLQAQDKKEHEISEEVSEDNLNGVSGAPQSEGATRNTSL